MNDIVVPQGVVAVLITLVVVAIAAGVVLGALRSHRFTGTGPPSDPAPPSR